MTNRPALICPRCGSSDVLPRQVAADGTTTFVCADANCGQEPWTVPAPRPVDVEPLVRMGERLTLVREAADKPDLLGLASAFGAAYSSHLEREITDLVREGVAA